MNRIQEDMLRAILMIQQACEPVDELRRTWDEDEECYIYRCPKCGQFYYEEEIESWKMSLK